MGQKTDKYLNGEFRGFMYYSELFAHTPCNLFLQRIVKALLNKYFCPNVTDDVFFN